jgi:hypothetical protein
MLTTRAIAPHHATTSQETAVARERLLGGVARLTATNAAVESMRSELRLLQPVLADKTQATQVLLEEVRAAWGEGGKGRGSIKVNRSGPGLRGSDLQTSAARMQVGRGEGGGGGEARLGPLWMVAVRGCTAFTRRSSNAEEPLAHLPPLEPRPLGGSCLQGPP